MLHHLHHGWLSLSCYFVHWYSPSTPYAAHSPWEKNNKDGQVKARWTVIPLNDQDEWGTLQDFQSVPPAWLVSLNHRVVLQHRATSSPPLINKSIPFSKSNSGILCDHRQAGRLRRNNEVKFTSKSNIKTKPKEKKNIYKYISVFFTYFCFTFCSFYVISYACLTWKKGNIYSRFRHKQPLISFQSCLYPKHQSFLTADILTCDTTERTGETNNTNEIKQSTQYSGQQQLELLTTHAVLKCLLWTIIWILFGVLLGNIELSTLQWLKGFVTVYFFRADSRTIANLPCTHKLNSFRQRGSPCTLHPADRPLISTTDSSLSSSSLR